MFELPSKPWLNACLPYTHAIKDPVGKTKRKALHEVVEEVLIAVLVTRHSKVLLRHHVVVGVVPLPCELLALFCDLGFLLSLQTVLESGTKESTIIREDAVLGRADWHYTNRRRQN